MPGMKEHQHESLITDGLCCVTLPTITSKAGHSLEGGLYTFLLDFCSHRVSLPDALITSQRRGSIERPVPSLLPQYCIYKRRDRSAFTILEGLDDNIS
jgi:hypothetical protein